VFCFVGGLGLEVLLAVGVQRIDCLEDLLVGIRDFFLLEQPLLAFLDLGLGLGLQLAF
jgi:hypothetical protein